MHECYAMKILETKKTKTIKKNGHKMYVFRPLKTQLD